MNIEAGDYILKSDGLSMWIEQKYIGKNKSNEETEYTRRVTGYFPTFQMLYIICYNTRYRPFSAVRQYTVQIYLRPHRHYFHQR